MKPWIAMCFLASALFALDFNRESYFQNLCDQNDAKACLALGAMYHVGDGVHQNFPKARELYTKACQLELAEGCTHLAYMYENGHAGIHPAKALDLYAKACEMGDMSACASVAKLYENGVGTDENMQKAVDYYDKACEAADAKSCTHLGTLYEQDGNDAYAVLYYQKACDANDASTCTNLGMMYLSGKGINVNEKKAYQLFQQACSLGDEAGCKNYESMKNAQWY